MIFVDYNKLPALLIAHIFQLPADTNSKLIIVYELIEIDFVSRLKSHFELSMLDVTSINFQKNYCHLQNKSSIHVNRK